MDWWKRDNWIGEWILKFTTPSLLCKVLQVYKSKPENLEGVPNRILKDASLVDEQMIRRTVSNFYQEIAHC